MFGLSTQRKPDHEGSLMERSGAGLADFGRQFDRLFERFWADFPKLTRSWEGLERFPELDWEDQDDRYVLRAEAPGFEPQEFDVQVRGQQLVLSAEHREEQKDEKHGQGRFLGRFYQAVTLPPGIIVDQVDAKYRNGILEIHLPKSPEVRAQRIAVKAE